jgi:hypothetical protein
LPKTGIASTSAERLMCGAQSFFNLRTTRDEWEPEDFVRPRYWVNRPIRIGRRLELRAQMPGVTETMFHPVKFCARAARLRSTARCAMGMIALAMAILVAVGPAAAQQVCLTDTGLAGVALGSAALACGTGSFANSSAAGAATAIGQNATATGNSTSVGANSGSFIGTSDGTVSIGNYVNNSLTLSGQYSTAIGTGVISGGGVNTAAASPGNYSVAIGGGDGVGGVGAQSTGAQSIAIGLSSAAAGVASTAIGSGAKATTDNSVALGNAVTASGTNSFAAGNNSSATGASGVAIGDGATAGTGANAIAIGTGAVSTGSVAIGAASSAAFGNTAIGDGAQASAAAGGTAFGNGSVASATNTTAIGAGAVASGTNSVAIGAGSVASGANTVSVGSAGNERRITNVAAGINPTDAVNVSQLAGITAGFQGQIGNLQNQVTDNLREARAGIALAMAAGALQFDQRPGKLSVAGSYGNFKGSSGLAVGIGYAATDRWRVNAAFSGSPDLNAYGGVVSSSFTLN